MKTLIILVAVAKLIRGSTATRLSAASLRHAKQGSTEGEAGRHGAYPEMPVPKAFPFPENISPKRCPTGNYHVGCFYDTQLAHRRWYDEEVPKENRVKMTPDLCYAFCSKVSGVQYFGLTRGDRCYCTPFFHNTGMNAHGDCDMPCVGDFSQMCGGMERSDVYVLHDCKNLPDLPCKKAPPSPMHAKMFKSNFYRTGTPCSNARREPLTTMQTFCNIECKTGFYLAKNEIRCVRKGDPLGYSWAQVQGQAVCQAISCGKPPILPHAQASKHPALYGVAIPYSCQLGYSIDSSPKGPKDFRLVCGSDGSFNVTKDLGCYKVKCGKCPTGEKYNNSKVAEKEDRFYSEKCHYGCNVGYTLDAQPIGKTDFSLTCLPTGEFSEPKTCDPVSCGAPQAIDNAKALTKGEVAFPGFAEYEVNEGFTIINDVKPGQNFHMQCQSNGKFSEIIPPKEWSKIAKDSCLVGRECEPAKPEIEPVPCGKSPEVKNSIYDDKDYFFGQSLVYECKDGYTVTGTSKGEKKPEVECGSKGKYLWNKEKKMPECLPVECGEAPEKKNAQLVTRGVPSPVTAASKVLMYVCNAGYSTAVDDNPYKPLHRTDAITCQATGKFTEFTDCVNINDCSDSSFCGDDGECVDIDPPIGTPFDDYKCKCNAGFEQTIMKGAVDTKQCTNINDCPDPMKDACGGLNRADERRGTCVDVDQTYTCTPSAGYEVEKRKNETCVPKVCGKVPEVENAKSLMVGKIANYDTEPWKYTCNDGYSLTGEYGGETSFPCRCKAAKRFSTLQKCLPVSCGSTHAVQYTMMSPVLEELKFPTILTYTADTGYSLTGKTDGDKTFEVKCLSDGTQTEPKEMLPVECGATPEQEFADSTSKKILVFKDSITIKCKKGYSTDETPHPDSLQYDITCEAGGKLDIPSKCKYITIPLSDVPIDCGKPPKVEHSTWKGSTLFGKSLIYTADEGYSLDGSTTKEMKQFVVKCQPTEEFTASRKFQRIRCGSSPDVAMTKSVQLIKYEGASFFQSANAFRSGLPQALQTHQTFDLLYGDAVQYTCSEGHKVDRGRPVVTSRDPDELTLKCDGTGNTVAVKPSNPATLRCVPVNCRAPTGKACKNCEANLKKHGGKKKLEFKDTQEFLCDKGYSIDGTPEGEQEYFETCQKDGRLTSENKCQDMDWCIDNQCGGKGIGKCEDGLEGYSCKCRKGYKEVPAGGIHKKCVEIDECNAQEGNSACAGDGGDYGKCTDGILRYTCECNEGSENTTNIFGRQQCTAVFCPSIAERDFSTSEMVGKKMQYKNTAKYVCKSGYSIDGDKDGVAEYKVKCLSDGKLSEVDDCKPLKCPCVEGSCVPEVENAAAKGSFEKALTYGESAKFECDEGYTTTGDVQGEASFEVRCTVDAKLTEPLQCLPIECGEVPKIQNAVAGESKVLVYKDVATVECAEGYTTTGEAEGSTSFKYRCMKTGKLLLKKEKGSGGVCLPVSCGYPKKPENAELSMRQLFFMDEVRVLCHSGYSVDADANGESSFVGRCTKDGKIGGMLECKPVSCGKPEAEAGAESKDGETFFKETATWNCLPGFSTDGFKGGDVDFSRACLDHGNFGQSSPDACMDIDFCFGNPCTSNGVCTDLGEGKIEPSYSCKCNDGYEIKKNPDGSDTCSEDDCAGNPCGAGGTCEDLSKVAKKEGAYTCECELGYKMVEPEENKPICIRRECGTMPTEIQHLLMEEALPKVALKTWNDKPSDLEKGVAIMKAGDSVKYTCAKGYSTDGKYTKESLDFTLRCEVSGLFSRPITGDTECTLIKCDNWQRPMVPFAKEATVHEEFYEYGDTITFECESGYTTDEKVGGPNAFDIECTEKGVFTEVHKSCLPISCEAPEKNFAKSSAGLTVKFGAVVSYTCDEGYAVKGELSFLGTCSDSGKLTFEGGVGNDGCEPIECGTPEMQPNADLLHPHESLLSLNTSLGSSGGLFARLLPTRHEHVGLVQEMSGLSPYPEGRVLKTIDAPVTVVCRSGYTLGGVAAGAATYSIECQNSGKLIAMLGNSKVQDTCDAPKFQVSGVVTDAQSASIFLDGANIIFSQNGQQMASAETDSYGKYSTWLAAGTYTTEASRNEYIKYEAEIIVVTKIKVGGAGDVALSKVLPPGEWRVTLTWAAHSEDLDSHTYLGEDAKDLVYFGKTSRTDFATQMSATLDRDDVTGYGPETTTFKGVGSCTVKDHCLVKFFVDNYTPKDGDIGASEAIITVYQGQSTMAKYNLPTEALDARIWPIFTLDSKKDAVQVLYDGDVIYGEDGLLIPNPHLPGEGADDDDSYGGSWDYDDWDDDYW